MPEITRFHGIVIKIFFTKEHKPPRFHAVYGEYNGIFEIKTLEMIEGDLPLKAQCLVKEWAGLYINEIYTMWETKILTELPPL